MLAPRALMILPGTPHLKTAIRPNKRLPATEHARSNARVAASMETSANLGIVVRSCAFRIRTAPNASAMPKAAPMNPRTRLSTSSPRAILHRPAPKAARIANSCVRACALTMAKFATLAQTSKKTNPSAPITTPRTVPMSPVISRFSGRNLVQDSRGVLIGKINGDSRFQPCNAGIGEGFEWQVRPGEALRKHNVGRKIKEPECLRHHTDHLAGNKVNHNRAAEDSLIAAEPPHPIRVRKNNGFRRSRPVVFDGKPAPQEWLSAQYD